MDNLKVHEQISNDNSSSATEKLTLKEEPSLFLECNNESKDIFLQNSPKDDDSINDEPSVRGRWKRNEHMTFLKGCLLYKNDWKLIHSLVKTRTSSQIRSHSQKYFIKLNKKFTAHQDLLHNFDHEAFMKNKINSDLDSSFSNVIDESEEMTKLEACIYKIFLPYLKTISNMSKRSKKIKKALKHPRKEKKSLPNALKNQDESETESSNLTETKQDILRNLYGLNHYEHYGFGQYPTLPNNYGLYPRSTFSFESHPQLLKMYLNDYFSQNYYYNNLNYYRNDFAHNNSMHYENRSNNYNSNNYQMNYMNYMNSYY